MKILSIIGIFWFTLSLILIMVFSEMDVNAAMGWGVLGLLYAIPFSIITLTKSNKIKNETNLTNKLLKLSKLKEKGILSNNEFQAVKIRLLEK